jgi:hypothetical protein
MLDTPRQVTEMKIQFAKKQPDLLLFDRHD